MYKFIYLLLFFIIYLLIGIFIINIISSHPFTQLLDPYIIDLSKYLLSHKSEIDIYNKLLEAEDSFLYIWSSIPLLLLILYLTINSKLIFKQISPGHNNNLNTYGYNSIILIAIAAGLSLFIELMIIRLHSSYFQILAFHKNFSLLSCLFGLGIGYIFGGRPLINLKYCFPMFSLQILFMFILRYTPLGSYLQNPISEQIAMGQGFAQGFLQLSSIYVFIITIYLFNAICFIPLGHLISNLMLSENNLNAYSYNLIGSICGIILFSIISYFWTPPIVWLLISFTIYLIFIPKNINNLIPPVLSFLFLIIILGVPHSLNKFDIYSPYQILTVDLSDKHSVVIKTSNLFFQKIHSGFSEQYELPYYFNDILDNVLIVGSGTGNDVAAALRNNAKYVDSVEIDPAIQQLGEILHPDNPYKSNNVSVNVEDARSFIRDTNKLYDLIVYGLLDSHIMLSGLSGGIRVDSYVYTIEAFREARSKLNKNGIISLSFSVLSKDLGTKIYLMLKKAFDGKDPIVFSSYSDNTNFTESRYTYIIGDSLEYYVTPKSHLNVSNLFNIDNGSIDLSTDDWPFFYMPYKKYPLSYLVIIVIIFSISVIYTKYMIPLNNTNFSITSFFLGAGFMLLETKGITELALAYGSTWFVTAIVIIYILFMAYFANLFVIKYKPDIRSIYSLLILSIVLSLVTRYIDFSIYSSTTMKIILPILLTFPVFFSGLAFSSELKHISLKTALSSNILGAMFGGLVEYNTMYFGYKSLYIIIIVMYVVAFCGTKKRPVVF